MLAVVVKGGPGYHVYDYVGTSYLDDTGLQSPATRRNTPQISHYNVCYIPPAGQGEGCTPGYWRNHAGRWAGVSAGADFDATFGVDLFNPDLSLAAAIWLTGGGHNAFARHATAALLNAYAMEVARAASMFPLPTWSIRCSPWSGARLRTGPSKP